jgi:hypothetical protein
MVSEPAWRRDRLARLGAEHDVRPQPGTGRYAAVLARNGGREMFRSDQIAELLDAGELVALVNLDLAPGDRAP